jgi:hypothetical protein
MSVYVNLYEFKRIYCMDCAAVRQCGSVRQCGNMRQQCGLQCVAVRTVVCAQCAWQCAAVRAGCVRHCVASCGIVWWCGVVCGSVLYVHIHKVTHHNELIGMHLVQGTEPHISRILMI